MVHNVLVVGNGFDLHHGLRTRYNDFIDYIKEENKERLLEDTSCAQELEYIVKENGFIKYFLELDRVIPGWIDFEREIENILAELDKFLLNYPSIISKLNNVYVKKLGVLGTMILLKFGVIKQVANENFLIEPRYYNEIYGLNTDKIIEELKNHLDGLNEALRIYLVNMQQIGGKCDKLKVSSQIAAINPLYVINFNYTSTCKIYNISDENIFYIHGSLEKKNMVLGIRDKNEKALNFVWFKKYFQRIQKFTGYIDDSKMLQTDECGDTMYPIIHFYGHSMDSTDGDIIQELYNKSMGFVIYYYDQQDYERKVINLIDIFGKQLATKDIRSEKIKFVLINRE